MTEIPHEATRVASLRPVESGSIGIEHIRGRPPDAVMQLDVNGTVEAANGSIFEIFGWNPDDLVGQSIAIILGTPDHQACRSYIERYPETGSNGVLRDPSRTLSGLHKSGRTVEFELTVGEMWVAGQRKFIAICQVESERMLLERQRKMAARELRNKIKELELLRAELIATQLREYYRVSESTALSRPEQVAIIGAMAARQVGES